MTSYSKTPFLASPSETRMTMFPALGIFIIQNVLLQFRVQLFVLSNHSFF